MVGFVDRDEELDQFTVCYGSNTAEFVVICGRGRLGKSESVRQSIADRNDAIYYQVVESTAQNQLEQFVDTATAQFCPYGTFVGTGKRRLKHLVGGYSRRYRRVPVPH